MQIFKEFVSSVRFSLEKLKNHRNYDFCLTHLEHDFVLSIYDKKTSWEVVRIF